MSAVRNPVALRCLIRSPLPLVSEEQWRDDAWVRSAHDWIDERLAGLGRRRTGAIEQPHVRTWGTVMRARTADGDVWFKAQHDELVHEARVHAILAARSPERVPPLLASDPATGWMLLADAGRRLREVIEEERSLARWHDVLDGYACVQLASRDDVPALLAAGIPHHPLETLADRFAALVERIDVEPRLRDAARVRDTADELASYGIAESVQHDDLHDAQVFLGDGSQHLVLDWGDACVSHPFLTLAVTLVGVIAWGLDDEEDSEPTGPFRDTYLAPFAEAYGTAVDALAPAADLASRLGWALRAVNGHVEGDDASTATRLRMFAD